MACTIDGLPTLRLFTGSRTSTIADLPTGIVTELCSATGPLQFGPRAPCCAPPDEAPPPTPMPLAAMVSRTEPFEATVSGTSGTPGAPAAAFWPAACATGSIVRYMPSSTQVQASAMRVRPRGERGSASRRPRECCGALAR